MKRVFKKEILKKTLKNSIGLALAGIILCAAAVYFFRAENFPAAIAYLTAAAIVSINFFAMLALTELRDHSENQHDVIGWFMVKNEKLKREVQRLEHEIRKRD